MLTLFADFRIIINRKDTKFTKEQNFAGGSGAYTVLERRVNAGARLKAIPHNSRVQIAEMIFCLFSLRNRRKTGGFWVSFLE